MLRKLNRRFARPPAKRAAVFPPLQPADLVKMREAALVARAEADAAVRQAEAALRGLRHPDPDPAQGQEKVWRPAVWSRAAPVPRLVSPASGSEVAPGLTLFHDCPLAEFSLHQTLCGAGSPAPFSLRLDILRFHGSFLSLCLHIDDADAKALTADHVLRVSLLLALEVPRPVYARLNLAQGPNRPVVLRQFPLDGRTAGRVEAAFDMACDEFDRSAVDAAWLDIIIEKPAMTAIDLEDLVLSRAKRADL